METDFTNDSDLNNEQQPGPTDYSVKSILKKDLKEYWDEETRNRNNRVTFTNAQEPDKKAQEAHESGNNNTNHLNDHRNAENAPNFDEIQALELETEQEYHQEEEQQQQEQHKSRWKQFWDPIFERDASLFMFTPNNTARNICLRLTSNLLFDLFIFAHVIALIALILVFDSQTATASSSHVFLILEWYFYVIFLLELILRVIRRGFWFYPRSALVRNKFGRPYLRIPWHAIDLVVVISTTIGLVFHEARGVRALRAVRVLVPLKSLYVIPQIREVMNGFFKVVPKLLEILLFAFVNAIVFSQLGLQMFIGRFHQYCTDGMVKFENESYPDGILCGSLQCHKISPELFCAIGPTNSTEVFAAPNYGYSQFDNMYFSFISVFTALSLEGWTETMYFAMYTTSPWSAIFFVVLIVFGTFVVLNLVVAVVAEVFTMIFRQQEIKNEREKQMADELQPDFNSIPEVSLNDDQYNALNDTNTGDTTAENKNGAAFTTENVETINAEGDNGEKDNNGGNKAWFSESYAPAAPLSMSLAESISSSDERLGGMLSRGLDWIKGSSGSLYRRVASRLLWMSPYRKKLRTFLELRYVDLFIILCIVVDTAVLASYHYPASTTLISAIRTSAFFFTVVFVIEVLLKLIAYGGKTFFKDGFNTLNFVVSLSTLIMSIVVGSTHANGAGITAIRSIRLLRIFYAFRNVPLLRSVIQGVGRCLFKLIGIIPLVGIFWFILAVIGNQFFGEKYIGYNGEPCSTFITEQQLEEQGCPRWTFSTLGNSLVVVFQIMTGEDWNQVMFEAMNVTNAFAALFFVLSFTVMNYLLLNVMLTFILYWFQSDVETSVHVLNKFHKWWKSMKAKLKEFVYKHFRTHREASENDAESRREPVHPDEDGSNHRVKLALSDGSVTPSDSGPSADAKEHETAETVQAFENGEQDPQAHSFRERRRGWSLYLFSPSNRVRRFMVRIEKHWTFHLFIDIVLVFHCIVLTLWAPTENGPTMKTFLTFSAYALLCSYVFELSVKIIARGLILSEHAVLHSVWEWVSMLVVVYLLFDIIIDHAQFQIAALILLLRTLYVFRAVPGMHAVGKTLLLVVPPSFGVTVVVVLLYLIFGILGVYLFAGRYFICDCSGSVTGCDTALIAGMPNAQVECTAMGGSWVLYPSNFDNIGAAFSTLFEIATLENWVAIMTVGVDGCGVDMAPKVDCSIGLIFYFIIYILLGSIFSLNLYISVVVDSYLVARNWQSGLSVLSQSQREWIEWQRIVKGLHLRPPRRPPRRTDKHRLWTNLRIACFKLVRSKYFGYFVDIAVALNSILLSVDFFQAPQGLNLGLLIAFSVLTAVFLFEVLLKLIGLGPKQGFASIIDFVYAFAVVTMIIEVIIRGLQYSGAIVLSGALAPIYFLLYFRIFTIVRILKYSPTMKSFLIQLWLCFPGVFNVLITLAYFYYVFAFIGVALFGTIPVPVPNPPLNGGGVSSYACFRNFLIAILTLARISTGEAWNAIMWDIKSLGGAYAYSPLYFVPFVILSSFIITNLFVAIVIELYTITISRRNFKVSEAMVKKFMKEWKRLDPYSTRLISVGSDLRVLLREVEPPLGVGAGASTRQMLEFLSRLNVPITEDGNVSLSDLLYSLVCLVYENEHQAIPEEIRASVIGKPSGFTRRIKTSKSIIMDKRRSVAHRKHIELGKELKQRIRNRVASERYTDVRLKEFIAAQIIQDIASMVLFHRRSRSTQHLHLSNINQDHQN